MCGAQVGATPNERRRVLRPPLTLAFLAKPHRFHHLAVERLVGSPGDSSTSADCTRGKARQGGSWEAPGLCSRRAVKKLQRLVRQRGAPKGGFGTDRHERPGSLPSVRCTRCWPAARGAAPMPHAVVAAKDDALVLQALLLQLLHHVLQGRQRGRACSEASRAGQQASGPLPRRVGGGAAPAPTNCAHLRLATRGCRGHLGRELGDAKVNNLELRVWWRWRWSGGMGEWGWSDSVRMCGCGCR